MGGALAIVDDDACVTMISWSADVAQSLFRISWTGWNGAKVDDEPRLYRRDRTRFKETTARTLGGIRLWSRYGIYI